MATRNAIYVRVTEPAKVASLRAEYPSAYTEAGSEFYGVEQGWLVPEAELARLSARLATDVLWLGFQTAVDAFQFYHWRSGKQLRALVDGCFKGERTWERAEGEPEEWERAVIFDPTYLAYALQNADSEHAEELQRIWREAEIVPGRMQPMINARKAAPKVAEFYGLPGWS
jgi:hypothetical protein